MTTVSVLELQRAWKAVENGEFRGTARRGSRGAKLDHPWRPGTPVIVVAGATGRVGASTVALGVASAAEGPVRILECGPAHLSGLAAATTAELGVTPAGWRQSTRAHVLVERPSEDYDGPESLRFPEPCDRSLTILDLSWDLRQVTRGDFWLAVTVATTPLVIVTVATAPGLRALDVSLHAARSPVNTRCVVVGPQLRRWPKPLQRARTARIDAAIASGRLRTVPQVDSLALTGMTPAPLPTALVAACTPLLDLAVETERGNPDAPAI